MFKASIALVLLAFGALAYGWIANNDTILYGSIGASALAGLALLASQRSDDKEASAEPTRDKAEKPARKDKAAEPAPAKASDRGKSRRLPNNEITRQLDLSEDDDDLSSLPQPAVRPISSPPARKRQVKTPDDAAWATEDDFADEAAETDYETAEASYEAGFQEEAYPEEGPEAAASYKQGAAAADDFRSRLAAVLGQPGLPPDVDLGPPAEQPAPLKPARTRRAAAAAPVEEPKPPVRRGRRKAEPVIPPDDDLFEEEPPPPPEEADPDWIRLEDVPRIARATQPGGGFARPDPPAGPTPYRPKRPAVGKPAAGAADAGAPATRRRTTTAAKGTAAKGTAAKAATPKTAAAKPRAAKPAVTRVAGTEDEAPKPRRGRPPKPKP